MLTCSPPASCHLLTAPPKGWKFGNATSARGHQAPVAGVCSLGFCRRQGKPKHSTDQELLPIKARRDAGHALKDPCSPSILLS